MVNSFATRPRIATRISSMPTARGIVIVGIAQSQGIAHLKLDGIPLERTEHCQNAIMFTQRCHQLFSDFAELWYEPVAALVVPGECFQECLYRFCGTKLSQFTHAITSCGTAVTINRNGQPCLYSIRSVREYFR